jgi:hypothetical protein
MFSICYKNNCVIVNNIIKIFVICQVFVKKAAPPFQGRRFANDIKDWQDRPVIVFRSESAGWEDLSRRNGYGQY